VDAEGCPICERGEPTDVVSDLPHTWVTAPPRTPLAGYVVIVSKTHVREPFELDEVERLGFWTDVDTVAAAIAAGLRPDKLNYEIHGNTIPHLHLHLFPRQAGDRFAGRPIDWRETEPRTEADVAAIRAALAGIGER
jgi:diadenosine tetraphosphate (Ap4A) HIT family hydrolase